MWLIFHFTSVSHCTVLLQFTTRWHSVKHLLYSAVLGPSAPQLSKCQFRMSDVQPQLRIFSCPIKNPFHIRSCTLRCAWNGTSDTVVHILSRATANQSCLVAIWTARHRCTELRIKWHLVSVFSVYMPVMWGLFTYLLVGGIYTVASTCPRTCFSGARRIIRGHFLATLKNAKVSCSQANGQRTSAKCLNYELCIIQVFGFKENVAPLTVNQRVNQTSTTYQISLYTK